MPLQQRVPSRMTTRWWTAYVLMWLFDTAYLRFFQNGQLTTESFQLAAILSTLCALAGILAAVLAVQVVQRISDFQATPLSPLRTDQPPG